MANLSHHADQLDQRLEGLNRAIAAREELYMPEGKALSRRRIVLDQARRSYNLADPKLRLIFTDDPLLVESFFLDLR